MTARPMSSAGVDVRREGVDGSRWYSDPETDRLLASVTTVISATTSMPWLTKWAAKLAAECAVDHHVLVAMLLEESGRDAAVDYIKGEANRARDKASELGTLVHDLVEALALDTSLPEVGDALQPFADTLVDWLCEWRPEILMSECAVASPAHGYAGTLDLVLTFPHVPGPLFQGADGRPLRWLLDVKSGQRLSAYMPVQLVAYKRASEVWLPGGVKAAMPTVDRVGVLHLRPGRAQLIDVTDQADDVAFRTFLRMLELLSWKDDQGGRMGKAVYMPMPDGSQPPPLLEDLDDVPVRAVLSAAGIYRLDHLVDFGPEKALALTGFGPGALTAVVQLLTGHGVCSDHWRLAGEALDAKLAAAADRKAAKAAKAVA